MKTQQLLKDPLSLTNEACILVAALPELSKMAGTTFHEASLKLQLKKIEKSVLYPAGGNQTTQAETKLNKSFHG